ncbi:MAG: hypothetical protein GX102_07475 [Porphyromonadaceae bacterium]|nr:hypothetical protein [Porphyromonadaceae bacterium]
MNKIENEKTKEMKQFGKIIFYYLAGLASIAGIAFTVYFNFFHKELIQLEIKKIDRTQLTMAPKTDGLSAIYTYQDSVVNNLWKIRYIISNVGRKAIISEGNQKNILPARLPVLYSDSLKILHVKINGSNFPVSVDNKGYYITLDFKQWKNDEFIDIVSIVEYYGNTEPKMSINEREIVDAKVISTDYLPNEIYEKVKLIDSLPKTLASFLKWLIVIVIIIADISAIFAISSQLKKDPNISNSGKVIKTLTFIIWLIVIVIFSLPLLWIF